MPSLSAKPEAIKVPVRLLAEWEQMKLDAKASNQTIPDYILGGWRLRKERARANAQAPVSAPTESAAQTLMRGVNLGRMFEDLRRALDAGREVDLGGYRQWCRQNRRDASLLRQWLGGEPRGPEYVDWWDREIARQEGPRQGGRTA